MNRLFFVALIPFFLAGCLEEEPTAENADANKSGASVGVTVNINSDKEDQPSSRERLRDVYAQ